MRYKIISDSSVDLTLEMQREWDVDMIPFKIAVEGREFVDDENLKIRELLDAMIASPNPIRTACPSPFDFQQAMERAKDYDGIFVLTISSKLSGSFNAAMTAKDLFLAEHPEGQVHILDSKSAGAGLTNIVYALKDIITENINFSAMVDKIEDFISQMNTFFILESLDNLIKNGRIGKAKSLLAQAFHIRPIMQGVDGEIELFELNRGFTRSLIKLANALGTVVDDPEKRVLTISHVDALNKAEFLRERVEELYNFKEIIITQTRGLASAYADNGGIIISF